MSVALSKVLLALEALVLAVPTTLWGVAALPVVFVSLVWSATSIAASIISGKRLVSAVLTG